VSISVVSQIVSVLAAPRTQTVSGAPISVTNIINASPFALVIVEENGSSCLYQGGSKLLCGDFNDALSEAVKRGSFVYIVGEHKVSKQVAIDVTNKILIIISLGARVRGVAPATQITWPYSILWFVNNGGISTVSIIGLEVDLEDSAWSTGVMFDTVAWSNPVWLIDVHRCVFKSITRHHAVAQYTYAVVYLVRALLQNETRKDVVHYISITGNRVEGYGSGISVYVDSWARRVAGMVYIAGNYVDAKSPIFEGTTGIAVYKIRADSDDELMENVVVVGNTVLNVGDEGIELIRVRRAVVANNITNRKIECSYYCRDVLIADNILVPSAIGGENIGAFLGEESSAIINVVFAHNVIVGAKMAIHGTYGSTVYASVLFIDNILLDSEYAFAFTSLVGTIAVIGGYARGNTPIFAAAQGGLTLILKDILLDGNKIEIYNTSVLFDNIKALKPLAIVGSYYASRLYEVVL